MALATKHRFTFKNLHGSTVQVDLKFEGYSGSVITHNQVAETPVLLNWEPDGDGFDKFAPIINGSAVTKWVVASSGESLRELMSATDLQYFIEVQVASSIVFLGPVVIGNYSEPFTIVYPFVIEITAGCGLTYLREVPFKNSSGYAYTYAGNMTLMEIIVACLGKVNPLSIYLYNNLIENGQTDSSSTSLLTQTYLNPQVFYSEDSDEAMSCYDVLSEIMKSIGSRLFQHGGVWRIYRIAEVTSASFAYVIYTSAGVYSSHGSTSHATDFTNTSEAIATRFVPLNDDAVLYSLMPYKKAIVQRQLNPVGNMLIAGNFHEWSSNDPYGWTKTLYLDVDSPVDEGTIGKVIRLNRQPDDSYYLKGYIRNDIYTNNGLKMKLTVRYRTYGMDAGTYYFKIKIKAIGYVDYYLDEGGTWGNAVNSCVFEITNDGEWHDAIVEASTAPSTDITSYEVYIIPGTLDGDTGKLDIDFIRIEPFTGDPVERAYRDEYKQFSTTNNTAFKYEPAIVTLTLGDRIISPSRLEVDRGWYMLSSGNPTDLWGPKGGTKNKSLAQILADNIAAQYTRAIFMLSGKFDGAATMARYMVDPTDGDRAYLPMRMSYDLLMREAVMEYIEVI